MPTLLEHPLANPRITQRFGLRESVYGADGHMGVDYGTQTGTPIWAAADGIVDKSGSDPSGYGEYVRIWHPHLNIYTLYGHFSKRLVKVGDAVKQKDVIGLSGNTGNSTGPHLHYEIRLATGKDLWVPVPGMRYSQVDPFAFWHGLTRGLPPEPPPPAGTVKVLEDDCNVRSGPGTNYSKVGQVDVGATGMASARNTTGTWVKLLIDGLDGWMAAFLITVEGGVPALPVYVEPPKDDFQRAMDFVARWEGGYVNNPADPGGATNMGITIGTLSRWRQSKGLPAATIADVKALTRAEANDIYRAWYWQASGADKMPWPMNLAHFDLAVNGGVGRAAQALAAVGPDFEAYMTWRENWYRTLSGFPTFGAGWLNRCRDLRNFVKQ